MDSVINIELKMADLKYIVNFRRTRGQEAYLTIGEVGKQSISALTEVESLVFLSLVNVVLEHSIKLVANGFTTAAPLVS